MRNRKCFETSVLSVHISSLCARFINILIIFMAWVFNKVPQCLHRQSVKPWIPTSLMSQPLPHGRAKECNYCVKCA